MNIIKNFKLFNESINDDMSSGEVLQYQLREYNSKKNSLRSLIMNNVNTDKDISKNYEDIVKDNPFLSNYGSILRMESDIEKREERIKKQSEEISALQKDISLLSSMSNADDRDAQKANIEESIKSKKEQSKENTESIKELQNEMKAKEEQLKQFIKEKTQQLKDIQKNVII